MAEVKEFIPKTIYDLVEDPDAPDKPYYEKFYDLPIMEKFDLIGRLGKNDPVWMKASDDERVQFIRDNNLIQQSEIPAAPGTIQTGETLSNPLTPEKMRAQSSLTDAQRAVRATAASALGAPADILNLPHEINFPLLGLLPRIPLGSKEIAKQLGVPQESMNILEQSLQTISGFVAPGAFLKMAANAGILPNAAQWLYKFFSAGPKMDAALGTTSAAGSAIGKEITPGSSVGPIVGGIGLPLVAGVAHTAGSLTKAAAQRRTLDYQGQRITEKATEAFGGPSLQEQLTGGTTTQTAQQGALENFVEAQKQPVLQAQASRGIAEQLLEAQQ